MEDWEFPEDFDFGDMPPGVQDDIEQWVNDWFDSDRTAWDYLDMIYDMLEYYDIEPEDFWAEVYG